MRRVNQTNRLWTVTSRWSALLVLLVTLGQLAAPLSAQTNAVPTPPKEEDFYRIISLPIPDGVVLEVGALELLPGNRLAAASRRGEIWIIDNPAADNPEQVKFTRYAEGLHEVLGLAWRDGWLYVTQRGEVSRLKDRDGDSRADLFETVCDQWEIGGDYHEYAFGSKFDPEGNLWVVLCLTGSFSSELPYRGWCVRVSADGKMTPTCSGLRSPGGVGVNVDGAMFYTDNQGPWNGTCALKHLEPGKFLGHPGGNRWYELAGNMGPKPKEPLSGGRMAVESAKIPELVPPAIYFPYQKMGQSASGIICDTTAGKLGPFAGQMFVGDQTHSTVMRVVLEKVNGRYQGACIPFRGGFGSGNLALILSPDGQFYVGGTNRGWGSRGSKPFALERMVWTGKTPFEIHEMHARPDGFELTFTEPVDAATAGDVKSYQLQSYTYIYHANYGSPEVDQTTLKVEKVVVSEDGKRARLYIDKLQPGHVHELHLDGVRSRGKLPLLHPVAYYTLNQIPAK
jgi:glucose/arabinose dehydrogenase